MIGVCFIDTWMQYRDSVEKVWNSASYWGPQVSCKHWRSNNWTRPAENCLGKHSGRVHDNIREGIRRQTWFFIEFLRIFFLSSCRRHQYLTYEELSEIEKVVAYLFFTSFVKLWTLWMSFFHQMQVFIVPFLQIYEVMCTYMKLVSRKLFNLLKLQLGQLERRFSASSVIYHKNKL